KKGICNVMDDCITPPDNWSLAKFLAAPRSLHPGFLVESLIPKCSLTMLSAEPGTGKTMLAGALGLAVAEGRPFLGLKTSPASVMVIGEDSPPWDQGAIFRKLLGGESPPGRFHLLANEGFRLLDPGWRERLGRYLETNCI